MMEFVFLFLATFTVMMALCIVLAMSKSLQQGLLRRSEGLEDPTPGERPAQSDIHKQP